MARGKEPDIEADTRNDTDAAAIVPIQRVQSLILLIRDQKVILDADLAELYGVPTKRLNEQARRNIERFLADFMFQLTAEETERLRSQIATSNVQPARRSPVPAIRFHRARRHYGSQRPQLAPGRPDQHLCRPRVCPPAADACVKRRPCGQTQTAGEDCSRAHGKQIVAIVDTIHLLMPPPEEPPKEPFGFRRARKN